MRRFELALPNSVERLPEDPRRARSPRRKLVAGGTDLLPQMKNGALSPPGGGPVRRGSLRVSAGPNGSGLRDRRRGHRARARADPRVRAGLSRDRGERGPGRLACRCATWPPWAATSATPRPRPTWRRRSWRWRPRRSSRARGGERRVPLAVVLHRRAARRCSRRTSCWWSWSCRRRAPHSGGSYLRHTPRRELDIAVVGRGLPAHAGRRPRAPRRASRWPRWRPTPVRATAAEQALEGQPADARAPSSARPTLAVEAARPISDQRGSADFRRTWSASSPVAR